MRCVIFAYDAAWLMTVWQVTLLCVVRYPKDMVVVAAPPRAGGTRRVALRLRRSSCIKHTSQPELSSVVRRSALKSVSALMMD